MENQQQNSAQIVKMLFIAQDNVKNKIDNQIKKSAEKTQPKK